MVMQALSALERAGADGTPGDGSRRARVPRIARCIARPWLAASLAAGAMGLLPDSLPGLSPAWAGESISVRALPSAESAPGAYRQGLQAVPGKRTQIGLDLICVVNPPTGWCQGGYVVANFGAHQGQRVIRAWTDQDRECVINDWYFACPMLPSRNGDRQTAAFLYEVDPWDYATNIATLVGMDGFALPQTDISIEMRGEGALRIETPPDMAIIDTAALTDLKFVSDGPSMNRGVTFEFGPFPQHLAPRLLDLDLPCALTPERVLRCGPVDQAPDTRGFLLLAVQTVHPLPPLPDVEFIRVVATSDLTPQVQTEFAVFLVERPAAP